MSKASASQLTHNNQVYLHMHRDTEGVVPCEGSRENTFHASSQDIVAHRWSLTRFSVKPLCWNIKNNEALIKVLLNSPNWTPNIDFLFLSAETNNFYEYSLKLTGQGLYLLIAPLGQEKTKLIHIFFSHPKTIRLVCLLSRTEINSFPAFLPAVLDLLILNSNDPIHSIYFGRLFSGGNTFVFMTQHIAQGDLHIYLTSARRWMEYIF